MKKTKQELKTYFETGDKPTEQEFCDLIDSFLHLDNVQNEVDTYFNDNKYSYDDLLVLKNKNALVTGRKYIISDYISEYYIENTNTSPIEKEETIEGLVSATAPFDPPLPTPVGTKIIITYLPADYEGPIKIGDRTEISANFSEGYYLKFANGLQNVLNARFSYSVPRYEFIEVNAVILDNYGKVVMQPDGVINTKVHDGRDYLDMTSEENQPPPIEAIVVTAISEDTFSPYAVSLTFEGDVLEYDFDNRSIQNEDGKEIGKRRGLVTRRINRSLDIDIDKDWRAQRYRRFKIHDDNLWKLFTLNQKLYLSNEAHIATLANENVTDDHRYILPAIENKEFYLDFTNGENEDPFLNGEEVAPNLRFGDRLDDTSRFMQTVVVNEPTSAKDITLLPLEGKYEPIDVEKCVIKKSGNTVFRDLQEQIGNYSGHHVEIDEIYSSTILTTSRIKSVDTSYGIYSLLSMDRLILFNNGQIENLINFGYNLVRNSGRLTKILLGAMPGSKGSVGVSYMSYDFDATTFLRECILAGKRVDLWSFTNVQAKNALMIQRLGAHIQTYNSMIYLTCFRDDGSRESVQYRLVNFKNKNVNTGLYGYTYHVMEDASSDIDASLTSTKGDLFYELFEESEQATQKKLYAKLILPEPTIRLTL